jgi:acyl-CoA dehydrogenase
MSELSLLRAEVSSGLREFVEASAEPGRGSLSTMASQLRFNNLKIAASEQAPRVCQGAMGVCGIMGFKNDTPFSVGRHLRDTMSACLMVANERIHQTNASLLLIAKDV